jgi:Yip1 domain
MESADPIGYVNPYEPPRPEDEAVWSENRRPRSIDLSRHNPLLTIWTRPRDTIRAIVEKDPHRHVITLSMAWGFVQTLEWAIASRAPDVVPLQMILGLDLILGPLIGLIGLGVLVWSLGLTGRWLGGKATQDELRAAIAWSAVPILAAIPYVLMELMPYAREGIKEQVMPSESQPALRLILMACGFVRLILGMWSFVLLLKCVGEVHRFSAWAALGSLALGLLLLIATLAAIGVLVTLVQIVYGGSG